MFSRSSVFTTEEMDGYRWARRLKDGIAERIILIPFAQRPESSSRNYHTRVHKWSTLMMYQYNGPKAVPKM